VNQVANQVNYLEVSAVASGDPILQPAGTSTNIDVFMQSKGTGGIKLVPGGGSSTPAFTFAAVASPANGITFTQVTTTNSPSIAATGSDTNINLTLEGKGSGVVNYGYVGSSTSGTSTPSFGTNFVGGTGGPQTATQAGWLEIQVNGTAAWIPYWH
jgi:hypothetical protein